MKKSNIGVIGMAVMGKNLALNFADQGYLVSIYNRTTQVSKDVVIENPGANIVFNETLEQFVESLEKPRKILVMVQAGNAIDVVLSQLMPLIDPKDIVIDGGNSYFKDTQRRYSMMKEQDFYYLALGVSGGEDGARFGPALMPSGDYAAYEQVQPMLDSVAAKAKGEACSAYIGEGASGHFVKMVHNGIEYGDMQLIGETYTLLKNLLQFKAPKIQQVFQQWNKGDLNSYLIEITSDIVNHPDPLAEGLLIDKIVDIAKQKGTGKWTSQQSLDLNVDASVLTSAVYGRINSEVKERRVKANEIYKDVRIQGTVNDETWVLKLENALYAAKMIAYAQGFDLLAKADVEYKWKLNMANIAKGWRAGCIIRAEFLDKIADAYTKNKTLEHLLFDEYFVKTLHKIIPDLRDVVRIAIENGYSASALSNAIAYFDSLTSAQSVANLIQAQRDLFGAHMFRRTDQEGDFHGNW